MTRPRSRAARSNEPSLPPPLPADALPVWPSLRRAGGGQCRSGWGTRAPPAGDHACGVRTDADRAGRPARRWRSPALTRPPAVHRDHGDHAHRALVVSNPPVCATAPCTLERTAAGPASRTLRRDQRLQDVLERVCVHPRPGVGDRHARRRRVPQVAGARIARTDRFDRRLDPHPPVARHRVARAHDEVQTSASLRARPRPRGALPTPCRPRRVQPGSGRRRSEPSSGIDVGRWRRTADDARPGQVTLAPPRGRGPPRRGSGQACWRARGRRSIAG